MGKLVSISFASVALVAPLIVGAMPAMANDDILALEPSSSWVLDYAEDSCALRRTFGEEGAETWLELRQYAKAMDFRVTVASRELKVTGQFPASRFDSIEIAQTYDLPAYGAYGEGMDAVVFYEGFRFALPDGKTLGELSDDERAQLLESNNYQALAEQTNGMFIENAFERPLYLRTGSLGAAAEAMATCLDELATHWGVTPVPLSQPVALDNRRNWIRRVQSWMPRAFVGRSSPAVVLLRVVVDDQGRASRCDVVKPVVDIEYQDRVCDIVLEHGRFQPALDLQGTPVATVLMQNIVYTTFQER